MIDLRKKIYMTIEEYNNFYKLEEKKENFCPYLFLLNSTYIKTYVFPFGKNVIDIRKYKH